MYLYANLMFIPAYFSSFSPCFCKYPTKILWFFLKFGQEKKRNCTKIVSLLIFKARSEAVWVCKRGTLPLTSSCEGKDYKHSGDKLQSSIGMKSSTLPLTSPCEGKDCKHSGDKLQSSIGMKSSTLPLTSPCSGTKRKTTVPLFFASTGGLRLLSFIPILLLSLH